MEDDKSDQNKKGLMIVIPLVFIVCIVGISLERAAKLRQEQATAQNAAADRAQAARERDEARVKFEAERADDRQKGFHCLSAWDGSNRSLVEQVEGSLRDPNSFEHANTWISPADAGGHHRIKMVFRARNGFGGMNSAEAIGFVDHEACDAVLEKITPLD